MSKINCKFLDHALAIRPNGKVIPCCRYDGPEEILTEDNYFNREYLFLKTKEAMANGHWPVSCRKCQIQEEAGNISLRTSVEQYYDNPDLLKENPYYRGPRPLIDENKEVHHSKPFESAEKGAITYLEIMAGRYCNLKCRMCTPELSTSWDEDVEKDASLVGDFFYDYKEWELTKKIPKTIDSFKNLDEESCKHLNEIKITGGEPFLSEYLDVFLQRLVDWGLAPNITLDIFTNCTFIPKEKYINNFNKFKMVIISLSIDGVGKRGEFIRKKSNWDVVSSNILWYCQYALDNKNTYVGISTTLLLYNVYYFNELIDWISNNVPNELLNGQDIFNFLATNKCFSPDHLSYHNLNNNKKKELINKIDKDFNYVNNMKGLWARNIYRIINAIKKDLNNEKATPGERITTFNSFNNRESKLDRLRNENWQEIFPELKEFLND